MPDGKISLDNIGEEQLFEINLRVNPKSQADSIRLLGQRELPQEGTNRVIQVNYEASTLSFSQGEYECTAILNQEGRLLDVRNPRRID